MKKKIALILLLLSVIFLSVYWVYNKIHKHYEDKYGRINQVYVNDFNGDGHDDALIIYYNFDSCAMECVDIHNDEELWGSYCAASDVHRAQRIYIKDSILIIAYWYGSEERGIEAFNSLTGEKVWRYDLSGFKNLASAFGYTKGFGNIFLSLNQTKDENYFLTAVNVYSGRELWQKKLYIEHLGGLYARNDSIAYILNKDFEGNPLIRLNVMSGDTATLLRNIVEMVLDEKQKRAYCFSDNCVYELTDSLSMLLCFNDHIYTQNRFKQKLLVNDHLIMPIKSDSGTASCLYTRMFMPESMTFILPDIKGNYAIYPYKNISELSLEKTKAFTGQYLPMLEKTNKDNGISEFKLKVYDTHEYKFTWNSIETEQNTLFCRHIIQQNGDYILVFDVNDSTELLLSFAGDSGSFISSAKVDFSWQNSGFLHYVRGGNVFSDEYFYQSDVRSAWLLNFPELTLKYTIGKEIKVTNGRKYAEEIFGEIPWLE